MLGALLALLFADGTTAPPPPPPPPPPPTPGARPGTTKGAFVTRVRQTADAVGAVSDWPTDLVLNLGTQVLLEEWHHVLDVAPYYRVAQRTVAYTNGRFPWSALDLTPANTQAAPTASDGAEFAHRILEVRIDGQSYGPIDPGEVYFTADTTDDFAGISGHSVIGDEVAIIGAGRTGTATVLVNHTPQLLDALASDDSVIPWIPGFESILWYMTAAMCLEKGGREAQAAMDLRNAASGMRQRLLATVARRMAAPKILRARDNAADWGGW